MGRKRMFLKRRDTRVRQRGGGRDRAPSPPLPPRFARLVRESWWLLVVAAFVWLALILGTYSKTDPSFSFSNGIQSAGITNRGASPSIDPR